MTNFDLHSRSTLEASGSLRIEPKRRRAILIAMCLALGAVVGSASGLNVIQKELALDLDASQSEVLWIINCYIVVLAALLMPMGAIADRWGRKPVLIAGFAVFGLSSVASAFADTVNLLTAARVLAGVGAAMIMPVTLSVITTSFPKDARPQAIGVWSAVAGGGGLLGMITAAVLVDFVDWRWVFVLPVLLVLAGMALTLAVVPNSREHGGERFDVLGSLLSLLAIGALVFGIHEGPAQGWTSPVSLVSLIGGALALVAFIVWELRVSHPLLDVRTFSDRRLSNGSTTLLVLFAVSSGVFVVLFPFFQLVLGWSALHSMVGLLPLIVVMMGASGLAAGVAKRFGSVLTTACGVGAAATGLALMAMLASVEGGFTSVLPGMLAIGLGMGLTMPIATEAITSSLPDDSQGVASALNDTTRELGSAIGIALLGAVLTVGYRRSIDDAVEGLPDSISQPASEGLGRAIDVSGQSGSGGEDLLRAAEQAFVEGWAASMWVAATATAVLLVLLLVTSRTFDRARDSDRGFLEEPAQQRAETRA